MKALKTREEWIDHTLENFVHPYHVTRDRQRWVDYFSRKYARLQVLRAVQRGELVKPSHCSDCGCGPLPNIKIIQGHHPDYNRPPDVQWLCSKCHWNKHKGRFYTR